jgi:hypothetical protein
VKQTTFASLTDATKKKRTRRENHEVPEGGVGSIMADDFFNIYDKTGPGMSNYKP